MKHPDRHRDTKLVLTEQRVASAHAGRVLVCSDQHPVLSIHPVALVPAVLHLVLASLANIKAEPASQRYASRSCRGTWFSWQRQLCLCADPIAQGAQLAGVIASRVLYDGQNLLSFRMEVAGLIVFFMLLILSPLLVFSSHLNRAKRAGLREFGGLASHYVQDFDEKWVHGGKPREEELLGNSDIQALADLGNSFGVVADMRLVPFGLKDVMMLAAATAAP